LAQRHAGLPCRRGAGPVAGRSFYLFEGLGRNGHVGAPKYRVPSEPDLAMLFEVAESAGVAWLMFDREAAVIDGLPVFDSAEPGP